MKILLASRSDTTLQQMRDLLGHRRLDEVESVLMLNGNRDPLKTVDYLPDVLVLHAGSHAVGELQALSERDVRQRPALIVFGDQLPTEAMKFAMRAGARDFIAEESGTELADSIERLEAERAVDSGDGRVVVVVNAKGGSGGTFVATSLGYLSAAHSGQETVIVDLDFQYGSLPHYLDVKPKRGLLEALEQGQQLDETAVGAYTVSHESGLNVLAPLPEQQSTVDFDIGERVLMLLEVLRKRYRQVIVDLPRHLDATASEVLRAADEVVVVMQQSLLSVHDAVRLKTVLVNELEIDVERLTLVVNRYSRNGALAIDDIVEALDEDDPVLIPNQFKLVAQALDMGLPVPSQATGSPVGKALSTLQSRVMGTQTIPEARSFLAKTVSRLRG